ncbi:uncharacterized protein LOC106651844 [Trichogramma pretiosum]|uniref:uncharacterized protein LOC106651844 n=1 Tax=Trichogramma pretiosum TaxID=7493 RepID=UPI0006C9A494|nr:uncharacterized protein LOC106651844 [Trichogramma pretiosum]
MPGTPTTEQQNNSAEVNQVPEDPTSVVVVVQQRDDQPSPPAVTNVPAREITQTDKLNKRLLVSFLNRMNSQSDSQKDEPVSDEEENNKEDSDSSFE